jgi:hypothetical protein
MMTMMMTMRVAAPPRAAFNLGFASQDIDLNLKWNPASIFR